MVSGGRRPMLPNARRPAVLTTLATTGCSLQAELLPDHGVERVERESATEPSCCLVPLSEAVQREQPHLVVARVVVRLQAHGLVERRSGGHRLMLLGLHKRQRDEWVDGERVEPAGLARRRSGLRKMTAARIVYGSRRSALRQGRQRPRE